MFSNIFTKQLKVTHSNGLCKYLRSRKHFLFQSKLFPHSDDEPNDANARADNGILNQALGSNPFLDTPMSSAAIEYKKGYVMRKSCYDANYKKSKYL